MGHFPTAGGNQNAQRSFEIDLPSGRLPTFVYRDGLRHTCHIIVSVIVIGLLLSAIRGCYLTQGRKLKQLADRTGPDMNRPLQDL
jgi:hypothetical protein